MSGQQSALARREVGHECVELQSASDHVSPLAYAPTHDEDAAHEQDALLTPTQYVPVEGPSHQGLVDSISSPSDAFYTSSVQSGTARFQPVSGCRDWCWSFLFLAHIIGMVLLAKTVYHSAVEEYELESYGDDEFARIQLTGRAFEVLALLALVGVVTSLAWLGAFKSCPRGGILITFVFSVLHVVGVGLFWLAMKEWTNGIFFLLWAIVAVIYVCDARERITFTAHTLAFVASLMRRFPTTSVIAIVAVAVQIAWSALWLIAGVGLISEMRDQRSDYIGTAVFLLLISFYWSLQVVRNVVHVTVAGLMASWYFLPADGMPKTSTLGAFRRATWSSFGSICFGSTLVSFCQSMLAILRLMRSSEEDWSQCTAQILLMSFEDSLEYFNAASFTQIAMYDRNYSTASTVALSLLKSSGLDETINDNLTDAVLFFASFTTGVIGALVGGVLADVMLHTSSVWYVWSIVGFLIAFSMSTVLLELISSTMTSFFVCFAEDPDMLRQTKPDVYDALLESLAGRWKSRWKPQEEENASDQI